MGEENDKHRQIQPALPGADISNIGDPDLVGPDNGELLLHAIRHYDGRLASDTTWRFIAVHSFNPLQLHHQHDGVQADVSGD